MKIDELKIKVDEAGLQYGKLPDGGGIVPMCASPAGSRCMSCPEGCDASCSAGCTSKCFLFSSKA